MSSGSLRSPDRRILSVSIFDVPALCLGFRRRNKYGPQHFLKCRISPPSLRHCRRERKSSHDQDEDLYYSPLFSSEMKASFIQVSANDRILNPECKSMRSSEWFKNVSKALETCS
jgi:hypothetical protein